MIYFLHNCCVLILHVFLACEVLQLNKSSMNKVYLVKTKIIRLVESLGFRDHAGPFFKKHRLPTVHNQSIIEFCF